MERIQMRPDLIMYSNKKGGEKVYFGLTKTYKYDFFFVKEDWGIILLWRGKCSYISVTQEPNPF